jgi:hypothetical protein
VRLGRLLLLLLLRTAASEGCGWQPGSSASSHQLLIAMQQQLLPYKFCRFVLHVKHPVLLLLVAV